MKYLCNSYGLFGKGKVLSFDGFVAADRGMPGMQACHQTASRWGANGLACICVRKEHAFFRQLVYVWGADATMWALRRKLDA